MTLPNLDQQQSSAPQPYQTDASGNLYRYNSATGQYDITLDKGQAAQTAAGPNIIPTPESQEAIPPPAPETLTLQDFANPEAASLTPPASRTHVGRTPIPEPYQPVKPTPLSQGDFGPALQAAEAGLEVASGEQQAAKEFQKQQLQLDTDLVNAGVYDITLRHKQAGELRDMAAEGLAQQSLVQEAITKATNQLTSLQQDLAKQQAVSGERLANFAVSARTRGMWGSIIARSFGMIGAALAGQPGRNFNAGVENTIMNSVEASIQTEQARLNSQLQLKGAKISSQAQVLQSLYGIFKDKRAALQWHRAVSLDAFKMEVEAAQTMAKLPEQRAKLGQTALEAGQKSAQAYSAAIDKLRQTSIDKATADLGVAKENLKLQKETYKEGKEIAGWNPKYYQVQEGRVPSFATKQEETKYRSKGVALSGLVPRIRKLTEMLDNRWGALSPAQRIEFGRIYSSALNYFKEYYNYGGAFTGNEEKLASGQLPSQDLATVFTDAQKRVGINAVTDLLTDFKAESDMHYINLGPVFTNNLANTTEAK